MSLIFDFTPIYPRGCRNIEEYSNLLFTENLFGKQETYFGPPLPLEKLEELIELSKFRNPSHQDFDPETK